MNEPATSQMKEYTAPEIQVAAVPVRVEKRQTPSGIAYRIVGIVWRGRQRVERLAIRFGVDGPWTPFPVCGASGPAGTWSLWEFWWRPELRGTYSIFLSVPDRSVPHRRLDTGYYMREVTV